MISVVCCLEIIPPRPRWLNKPRWRSSKEETNWESQVQTPARQLMEMGNGDGQVGESSCSNSCNIAWNSSPRQQSQLVMKEEMANEDSEVQRQQQSMRKRKRRSGVVVRVLRRWREKRIGLDGICVLLRAFRN